jgi:hypothetical protein
VVHGDHAQYDHDIAEEEERCFPIKDQRMFAKEELSLERTRYLKIPRIECLALFPVL